MLWLFYYRLPGSRQVDVTLTTSRDSPIEGARITVTEQQGTLTKTAVSTTDGARFENLGAAIYDVRIDANGFATKTVTADLRTQTSATLKSSSNLPGLSRRTVNVVTRTEQHHRRMPASTTVLRAEEITQSPAVAADDILRQVPTFSLFRRTSSLAAHPTTQGVSLRGVGPSGVSRTLVLIDDVPFNDPFGGWVYWTRVPLASVDRVEMIEGTNSSVYGNYALGGVINIRHHSTGRTNRSRSGPPLPAAQTHKIDFFGANAWDKFSIAAEGTTSARTAITPCRNWKEECRCEDPSIRSNARLPQLQLSSSTTSPTDRISAFLRGGYFSEDRINAKGPRPRASSFPRN